MKKCRCPSADGYDPDCKCCSSLPVQKILLTAARGVGAGDAAGIGNISINKRLPVSLCSRHLIQPEQNITAVRKQADFGRMRGRKAPDFIYADHREKAELQRGENGNKNSQRLGKKLSDSGVNCGSIAADD